MFVLIHLCCFHLTDPSVYTGFRHGPDYQGRGDRGEVKDRGPRGIKDARENIRERQKEKAKRQKEAARDDWGVRDDRDNSKEARKRIESLKERSAAIGTCTVSLSLAERSAAIGTCTVSLSLAERSAGIGTCTVCLSLAERSAGIGTSWVGDCRNFTEFP